MLERRTDLALEAHELLGGEKKLPGVTCRETEAEGFPLTTVEVTDREGAQALGKPEGTYHTLDLTGLERREEGAFPRAVAALAKLIAPLLPKEGEVLVVGLGNTGDRYEGTRHNVGFDVVDQIADTLDIPVQRLKYRALTNTAALGGETVLLMKPVTFMNLSGEAVEQAAGFFKVPPERIIVISDEVALEPGKLRIREGGSAGGHNGLKNIIAHLHSDHFPRIRVGVGQKPHPDYDMADWVLGKPQGEDRKNIDEAVKRAAQAVEVYIRDGAQKAMSRFN